MNENSPLALGAMIAAVKFYIDVLVVSGNRPGQFLLRLIQKRRYPELLSLPNLLCQINTADCGFLQLTALIVTKYFFLW